MIIREAKRPIKYENLPMRVSHVKAYVKAMTKEVFIFCIDANDENGFYIILIADLEARVCFLYMIQLRIDRLNMFYWQFMKT